MADNPGEAAGQCKVHGCSSYPLSFPSQPPDINNWFSSYEYESRGAPELVADAAGEDGSETQDPLEHSLLKHVPRDAGVALSENCLGGQSEPELFAGKYLVPVDGGAVKPAPKRKQILRALFGAGFLDNDQEATETESQVVLPVQRNALEPLLHCNAMGLPDDKLSHEGVIEHSKVQVDCNGISSVDTQESTPADQEVGYSKFPVDCDGTSLADIGKHFPEDGSDRIKLPANFEGTNLVATERSSQDGIDHNILPVSHNSISLTDTEDKSPAEETGRCKPALNDKDPEKRVASDGFVAVKRKDKPTEEYKINQIPKHPMGREKGILQENCSIVEQKVLVQGHTRRPLTDRTKISEVAAAPAPELCGKWKCPRKGNPYVGPPLKQLRLEQWVRRVN
ncbi:uncharacterized protein LOC133887828 [Phragmites australis]|uniref:uncharacterized protein LOC133887828 n=1 Tax=Phragmites australis TaxID=29695 RepID=UPI002D775A18|nr:uncharacterized protein LOC133887828 [Phragmites australis]